MQRQMIGRVIGALFALTLPALGYADSRSDKLAQSAQMIRQVNADHQHAQERLSAHAHDPVKGPCLRDVVMSFSALAWVAQNADNDLRQAAASNSPEAQAQFDDAYARVSVAAGQVDKLRLLLASCMQDEKESRASQPAELSIDGELSQIDPLTNLTTDVFPTSPDEGMPPDLTQSE